LGRGRRSVSEAVPELADDALLSMFAICGISLWAAFSFPQRYELAAAGRSSFCTQRLPLARSR
jgi:hypothetical protein